MLNRQPLACIVASILTVIFGITLLILASIYTHEVGYVRDGWPQLFGLSVYSIVIGALAIMLPIGLLYVVQRQFPALTLLFSVLVIIVAVMAGICGIVLITGRVDFAERAERRIAVIFRNYSSSDAVLSSKEFVTQLQQRYECCGYDMATDWKNILDGTDTPDSCCVKVYEGCGKKALIRQDLIFLRGCGEPIGIMFQRKYTILIAINFVVAGLALISGVFGFIYERIIRKNYELM